MAAPTSQPAKPRPRKLSPEVRAASLKDCATAPPGKRSLPVLQPQREDARVEPPVRGEAWLRAGESLFLRADRALSRFLPEHLNPLGQTGAIANTTLIVAIASGVLLLFWYRASVHDAYDSVHAMDSARFTSGFVRSVHRYSSDACMLFVVLHALKLFFARRFGGARWLAWITGAALIAALWIVGWLGYWLVWDERARQVALGTARMLDALPVFADPLSRSFLADDAVSSLLFFVVFFVHMLVPLGMGVMLWLHITRLSRPEFLTGRTLTAWVLGSLAAISLALPAVTAAPARMAVAPSGFTMDAWYLAPLALTDRLGAGALWAIALVAGLAVYSVPWSFLRRGERRATTATVDLPSCNACVHCHDDCPYDAIRMVPRTDGRKFTLQAEVDPAKCVGCGVCAGSCDSGSISLPWFQVVPLRARMDAWVDAAVKASEAPLVAFVCAESAGAALSPDANGRCDALPGYVVLPVPCAGWVHALSVERALRHGAAGVLIVGCGPGSERYREGVKWAQVRMAGQREPSLNLTKVDPARVRVAEVFRGDHAGLARAAGELRRGVVPPTGATGGVGRLVAAGLAAAAVVALATWAGSRVGYASPKTAPTMVVSFKHPGSVGEQCRELTEEEKRSTPPHMRPAKVCERRRVAVRLRVTIDGVLRSTTTHAPRGLWSDGNSMTVERLEVPEGEHRVRVELGDTPDSSEWNHVDERAMTFESRTSRVVTFNKLEGFQWR
ncbi:MAG: hydrogenase iron-sulfur subunit [Myxococcales bacterium]|nr:hydrogenase iron-sulfur subunit [Myxococcales bacterium]MBL0196137.1 hydrogenase iron-sulfur subunit [Myxococcales bacterium]HQY63177.1 hydrogenase iron-sulfur subunit [Polyangiaceae bacterium]